MKLTLKLCLLEQAILPQLDFLHHALDYLKPAGDDLVVDDEVLAETRRVFADLRRVLADTPLQLADPVAPITRGLLRDALREAVTVLLVFKEDRRLGEAARRRNARLQGVPEKTAQNLSPRVFPDLE